MYKIIDIIVKWFHSGSNDISIKDIEKPIRDIIVKDIALAIITLVVGVILSLVCKSFSPIILFALFAVLLFYQGIKYALDIIDGKIKILKGVFYELKEDVGALKQRYLIIMTEDKSLVKISIKKSFNVEKDNEIICYLYAEDLRKDNDDTLIVSNYIHIMINKSISELEFNFVNNEDNNDSEN